MFELSERRWRDGVDRWHGEPNGVTLRVATCRTVAILVPSLRVIEPVPFPVARCATCARDVVVAVDVDDADRFVDVCSRCGGLLDAGGVKRSYASTSLGALGYQLGDEEGCGGGGCGSCGSAG